MQILMGRDLADRMRSIVWKARQNAAMANFALAHVVTLMWHGVRPEAFPATQEQVSHHTLGTLLALYAFASIGLISIQFAVEEALIFPVLRQKYAEKGRRMCPIGVDQVERCVCAWPERVVLDGCVYGLGLVVYLPTALGIAQNETGGGFLVVVAAGFLLWKEAAQEGIERLSPWEREFP